LRVELIDDDGAQVHPPLALPFVPPPADRRGKPIKMFLVLNYQNLTFPHEGDYAFHILVDDLELGTVPVWLTRPREAGTQPESEGEPAP
jgi:hypothetical protein